MGLTRMAHLVAMAASVTCVGVACARDDRRALADARHPYTAYLAIRAADCDTHLQTLYALLVDSVHAHVGIGGVVVLGPPADTNVVRRALVSYDIDAPVVALDEPRGRALRRLARHFTLAPPPSVTIVARDGSLATSLPSPSTHEQSLTLARTLGRLASERR